MISNKFPTNVPHQPEATELLTIYYIGWHQTDGIQILKNFFNCQTYSIMATFEDFQKSDIRVGRIIDVQYFPEAREPTYKLKIDLGEEVGIKKSCAQLPQNYKINDLIGKQVLCVVNFRPGKSGLPFLKF